MNAFPYTHCLFDLDNTLLDFDRSSREAFEEVLEYLGMEAREQLFFQYAEINRRCWKLLEQGKIAPREVQRRRFAEFMNLHGLDKDALAVNDFYLDRLSEKAHWEDGAREVLDALREQGVSLALITNGLQRVQRPRLEQSGMTEYFDAIVISEEIGSAKPQRAYFEYTLNSLNNPEPEGVLVIGDNAGSDILGGQRMGMDTCWYNARQKPLPEGMSPPTYAVKRMRQVLYLAKAE